MVVPEAILSAAQRLDLDAVKAFDASEAGRESRGIEDNSTLLVYACNVQMPEEKPSRERVEMVR